MEKDHSIVNYLLGCIPSPRPQTPNTRNGGRHIADPPVPDNAPTPSTIPEARAGHRICSAKGVLCQIGQGRDGLEPGHTDRVSVGETF